MTVLTTACIVITWAVGVVWLSRHLKLSREARSGNLLTEDRATNAELPFLSVVIAAKDEQANIGRCVRTLLEQDYPDFEVIVVNDRSTDETAEIVQRLAEEDRRLRLINVGELPPGWCGKNHAMHVGVGQARGQYICMMDADCRQTSRHSLRAAVAYALDSGTDLLSVLPNLELVGFWENVVQPVCGGIMMIWFSPEKVNDPARPQAYANGAFMLMRRAAYDAIGGHQAVRDKVNEDMHLAARVKAAGLKLRVVRNRGLYLVRMYTSLRDIVQGWSRIFYGTFQSIGRVCASLAVLVVMSLLPYLAAAWSLTALALGRGPETLMRACAAVALMAIAAQLSVIWRFYRFIGARPRLFWTYPIGCVVAMVALLVALSKLRPGAEVTWRNTTYTHGR